MVQRVSRRIGIVCSWPVALLLFAAPAIAQIPNAYSVRTLQPFYTGPGLYESYAWDVNEAGEVCGTATADGTYVGYVFEDGGTVTRIEPQSWMRGINNAHHVVGHSILLDLTTNAQTIIPPFNDYYVLLWSMAINEGDVVVGIAAALVNEEGMNQTPFVWDPVGGTRIVPVPGANDLVAVNNANVAVGNIRESVGSGNGFVYFIDTQTAIEFNDLLVGNAIGWSTATHLNDAGVVVGEGWNGSQTAAFTWSQIDGFTFLPGLKGGGTDRVHPTGISDAGVVVGYALTASLGWRAFVWDPVHGMRDLNDLVTSPIAGYTLSRALRISADGTIVGDGFDSGGGSAAAAFMASPSETTATPETPRNPTISLSVSPNPFNPRVRLAYESTREQHLRIAIYDAAGARVVELLDRLVAAGTHDLEWQGRDAAGRALPSGVYFVEIRSPRERTVAKVTLLK